MTAARNLWQLVVLHLAAIEERHGEDVPLGVDADVRGRIHVAHQWHHVASTVNDMNGRVGPARYENIAIGKDFEAIVYARSGNERRGSRLTRTPRLQVRAAEGSKNEPVAGLIPRDAVGVVQGIAFRRFGHRASGHLEDPVHTGMRHSSLVIESDPGVRDIYSVRTERDV